MITHCQILKEGGVISYPYIFTVPKIFKVLFGLFLYSYCNPLLLSQNLLPCHYYSQILPNFLLIAH